MKREKYTSTHLNFESRIQVDNREKYLLYRTLSNSTWENGTDLKFIENVLLQFTVGRVSIFKPAQAC